MRIKRIVASILVLLGLSACTDQLNIVRGSGDVTSEDRPVEGIRSVNLATLGELTIDVGEQESLTIEAEENLLPYLETEVRGGRLIIGTEPGVSLNPTEPVRYYLTVISLEGLAVSSSGDIDAPSLTADGFTAEISSSGEIHLAGLDAEAVQVEISSSGDVTIDGGQVNVQQVTISSSGNYEAGDLRSATAAIDLSSNGSATVWVTDSLEADISSSGDINYYGSPEVDESTSSSGRVVSLGEK